MISGSGRTTAQPLIRELETATTAEAAAIPNEVDRSLAMVGGVEQLKGIISGLASGARDVSPAGKVGAPRLARRTAAQQVSNRLFTTIRSPDVGSREPHSSFRLDRRHRRRV